jgi:hypothetical protein
MGLKNQLGFEKNGNNWELSISGREKAREASIKRIEHFIEEAGKALQEADDTKLEFNKIWGLKIIESAFNYGFINQNEKNDYKNRL